MSSAYTITVLKESRKIFHVSPGRFYYFFEESFFHLSMGVCFCNACADFQDYESVYDRVEVAKNLDKSFRLPSTPEWLLEMQTRWYLSRKPPEKCLNCGGTDFVKLSHQAEVYVPALDSDVALNGAGFVSDDAGFNFFDGEGNYLKGRSNELREALFGQWRRERNEKEKNHA